MTCTVCPNCGLDLAKFEPVTSGGLELLAHEVKWKGKVLKISLSCRLILSAIVRADGVPVSRKALIEAAGSDTDGFSNLIDVYVSRIRVAFRAVDPMFDHLQCVARQGFRWVA